MAEGAPVSVVLILQLGILLQEALEVPAPLRQGLQSLGLLQCQHARRAEQLPP